MLRKLPVLFVYVKEIIHDGEKATLLLSDMQNTKSINGTIDYAFFKSNRPALIPGSVLLLQDVIYLNFLFKFYLQEKVKYLP